MSNLTIGDLAGMFQMRRDNARLKSDLLRLTQEVSTGRKADLSTAVAGDFGPVVGIDRQLQSLTAFGTAAAEAEVFTSSVQLAMEKVQTTSENLMLQLITAEGTGSDTLSNDILVEARAGFRHTVATLNGQAGGVALFAGAATDRAALSDADAMLAGIQAAVAGETTAAGVTTALDAWFGPGGGFEATGYIGSTDDRSGFRVAEEIEVRIGLKADDQVIRDTLKGLAMAALVEDGPLNGNPAERSVLSKAAGEHMLGNNQAIIAARSRVGSAEAAIERAAASNSAEESALRIARNVLTAVDPYAAATHLRETEMQLEALYSITARLSRLTLVNYLR